MSFFMEAIAIVIPVLASVVVLYTKMIGLPLFPFGISEANTTTATTTRNSTREEKRSR
jgi:hypothetical protein